MWEVYGGYGGQNDGLDEVGMMGREGRGEGGKEGGREAPRCRGSRGRLFGGTLSAVRRPPSLPPPRPPHYPPLVLGRGLRGHGTLSVWKMI